MPFDTATLDAPFASLKAYDWGADAAAFKPIDDAIVATHGDAAARADIERRLIALLGPDTSRACKEYVCRKLALIGTAAAVPALAPLLADGDNSHMARFALERMPAPEAGAALRSALGTVEGNLRIGVLSSLATRRDAAAVPTIAPLLAAGGTTAIAAATALGAIQTPEAIAALAKADPLAGDAVARAIVDARLACAEGLLRRGKRDEARAIYNQLATAAAGKPAARAIELAATRGIVACLDTTAS
jgi:HEAT repeat protein